MIAPTIALLALLAPAQAEIGLVPVARASAPPVLDAVAEPAWAKAVSRRLDRSQGEPPRSADIQGSFRALWDDQALYLFVEVLDDRKVRNQALPWLDDSVEVYVDGDGSRSETYDADDHQYLFGWNDPEVHEPRGMGGGRGVRFAQAAWEHGYRVEIALPWASIGASPVAGRAIGLDVHVNDNDGTGREAKLMWSDARDLASAEPRRFGRASLLATAEATAEAAAARTLSVADVAGPVAEQGPARRLQYHDIRVGPDGLILPWSDDDPARAFDRVVRLVWDFWRKLGDCPNGVPYVLQHQVWKPEHDPRGLGGDQISMALSSWNLLHAYLGDPALVADMRRQADFWIAHGFSGPEGPWPNLPFPYNTEVHSGRYDGDMVAGKGYLQPDKAGAFGAELVTLYQITGERRYLEVAEGIADTLARKVRPGDADHSPWPFRVHAVSGEVFTSKNGRFDYTSNWTGALRLFDALTRLGEGRTAEYARAAKLTGDWLRAYPARSQRWGPFFEDINVYSDTQINAGTFALYALEHPGWLPDAGPAVRGILDWCDRTFGNPLWQQYGVRPTNEQTAYEVPGNSHTAREASLELLWAEASGDRSRVEQAVRNLSWATYMVDVDGKNRYYRDDVWLTDGYGDYVRHYLRAMAAAPELAPPDQNHLLRTSSVVRSIVYGDDALRYEKWDAGSRERLKLGAWEPGDVEGGAGRWDATTRVLEVEATAKRVVVHRKAAAPGRPRVSFTVDAAKPRQRIDGFGVNVTPAQWRGGALRPVLERLTDELGASLVRLDCYGTADWLDPAQAGPDGRWPEAYLASVYRSPVFAACWDSFRALTARGADVHLNVSGRVPAAWTRPDGRTLANLEAYAEMVVSLARWAREKEGLRFGTFGPWNETDLGPPEGPRIDKADVAPAVAAVVRRMNAAGLGDVKLVLICDSGPNPVARYEALLSDAALVGRVAAFSGHTYGDGGEQDATGTWYDAERPTALLPRAVAASPHRGVSTWMTEYGDLDQTGAIEWDFAWRSTRRLLKLLEDGWNGAFAWDAFDNLHEHDGVWATYGLLRTDRASWTYTPRKRYFAAQQVYRFVRPGFRRVDVAPPARDAKDVYAGWHDLSRHVRLLAFASADGGDLTLVGTSRVEGELELEVSLAGLARGALAKPVRCYRTTRGEDARLVGALDASSGTLRVVVPEGSIFTLTTLP